MNLKLRKFAALATFPSKKLLKKEQKSELRSIESLKSKEEEQETN